MTTQAAQSLAVMRLPEVDRVVDALQADELVLLEEPAASGSNGYLVAQAHTVTAEVIARMLAIAHGTPFVALPADRCKALGLHAPSGSGRADRNFMVNIEAREGTTTGISAADRAQTMRVAADPTSTAADIIVPGHIVPARVEEGGVLTRAGAPEAAVDLVILAGGPGGAAMCQVLDDDGRAPSTSALEAFGKENDVPFVRTVDVLDQRLGREQLVRRVAEREISTDKGRFKVVTYNDERSSVPHYAILRGEVATELPVALRVRLQDPLQDALRVADDEAGPSFAEALAELNEQERGVMLYLAPSAESASSHSDAATQAGAELFAAKRRSHLITQMLGDLRVGSVDLGSHPDA